MTEPEQLRDLALALMTTRPEFTAGYECGLRDGMPIGRRHVLEEQDEIALAAARSGLELTFEQALEGIGEQQRAALLQAAVQQGRADFMRAARRLRDLQPYSEMARRRGQPERAEAARRHEDKLWQGWSDGGDAA